MNNNGREQVPDPVRLPQPGVEARLLRLETILEVVLNEIRDLKSGQRDLSDQIMKVRTTDLRVLVGMIITVGIGLATAIIRSL